MARNRASADRTAPASASRASASARPNWVDPSAVRPILQYGPALWVAARALLDKLTADSLPLHRSLDSVHTVVTWLLELAMGVQLSRSAMSPDHRRHFMDLLNAVAHTCSGWGSEVRDQTVASREYYIDYY